MLGSGNGCICAQADSKLGTVRHDFQPDFESQAHRGCRAGRRGSLSEQRVSSIRAVSLNWATEAWLALTLRLIARWSCSTTLFKYGQVQHRQSLAAPDTPPLPDGDAMRVGKTRRSEPATRPWK